VPDGWKLAWHDEFDGEAVDPANWTYDQGAGGWGTGEAEFYTARPENVLARFRRHAIAIHR
jgi:hypothetical protein